MKVCIAHIRPTLEYEALVRSLFLRRYTDFLERIQLRAAKNLKKIINRSYRERTATVAMLTVEEKKLLRETL